MKCITESRRRDGGFTLVELMIALVLGLIVVGGSLALFASQRATSRMSGQMTDVQAEGRIALDALARDLRAAGDFGCWPVVNPIDGRLNQMVFNTSKGGVLGYDNGAALPAANATNPPYGLATARVGAAASAYSVLVLTGVNGTLTKMTEDMAAESDALVVKTPSESFDDNDVAVVTDCINWAKFQVTSTTAGTAANTRNLLHVGGVIDAWGQGNKDGNLGAVFRKDSSVGRLDSVWWFVGTVNSQPGLYRMSARDDAPVLVSARVYALQVTYDLAAAVDGDITSRDNTAAAVDTNWPKVRAATVQMLMRSDKGANGGGATTVTSFAGKTIPSDNHVYLPLQMNVALRNQ